MEGRTEYVITQPKRNQSKVVRSSSLSRTTTQPEQQPHKFMIIANAIFYNGQSAERVYLGENLVWEKTVTPPTPTYGSKTFAGKFTDNTMESDWEFWPNGATGASSTKIKDYVDPETKEFDFDFETPLTSCNYLFNGNTTTAKFQRIDHIPDTSKVTDMGYMFAFNRNLEEVDLSDLNTSGVTNMEYMFSGCIKLSSLDVSNFNTENVTNMSRMFNELYTIKELDVRNINTDKVVYMSQMFGGNFSCILNTLYLNFNTSQVTNMSEMFWRQTALKNVIGRFDGTKVNLRLADCPLTADSAMVFINGLAEVSEAKTITFKSTTFDSLTPEQIAVATFKGWNVVRG